MASKKVVVDSSYKPVAAGSPNAAFIFNADDERLEKHRKAAEDAAALQSARRGRTAPAEAEAEEGTVERVGTDRKSR